MITPQLITYVRKQLADGVPDDAIRESLAPYGWTDEDISEAFTNVSPHALSGKPAHPRRLTSSKIPFAIALALISTAYTVWQYLGGGQPSVAMTPIATSTPQTVIAERTPPTPATSTEPVTGGEPSVAETEPARPVPTSQKPTGLYADGAYTGDPADAFYGTVQVQAVIEGGRLAEVTFLQSPGERSTSRIINAEAMPVLVQEAIKAQSAQVDTSSGATFTSDAFKQSLASALAQAKN